LRALFRELFEPNEGASAVLAAVARARGVAGAVWVLTTSACKHDSHSSKKCHQEQGKHGHTKHDLIGAGTIAWIGRRQIDPDLLSSASRWVKKRPSPRAHATASVPHPVSSGRELAILTLLEWEGLRADGSTRKGYRLSWCLTMTPRKRYAFWIESDQLEALELIRERDGVLPSEQIRRALDRWFEEQGVSVKKADRKRASTRRRSRA